MLKDKKVLINRSNNDYIWCKIIYGNCLPRDTFDMRPPTFKDYKKINARKNQLSELTVVFSFKFTIL